jgi:uncharacterized membrane protein
MKKISKNMIWLLAIISYIGTLISYPRLPEQIPVHWNSRFEVDGWSDKSSIFGFGLLPLLILICFELFANFSAGKISNEKHIKVYKILKIVTVILMIGLNWTSIITGLGYDINIRVVLPVVLGIFFILVGNYIPALKGNYFIGIRNPWTLADEYVWRKTHKAGGYLFIIIGILMIVMGFLNSDYINKIVFIIMLTGILGINVYSYYIYRKRY